MRSRFKFKVAALLAVACALTWGVFEAQSQQPQRRRPSRRATSPARGTPTPEATPDYEPRVISTAEDQAAQEGRTTPTTTNRNARRPRPTPTPETDETRRTMETLIGEFGKLNRKVGDLEKERRTDLIQERLTRAEQRAEGLQGQLRDVLEKEANLQAQIERVDDQSRPESIERQAALTGTFRPDELRDSIRRQLDAEKRRLATQLNLLTTSRTRLESALANADQLVQRLTSQLNDATQREQESGDSNSGTNNNSINITNDAAPRATPTPSATPPPQ